MTKFNYVAVKFDDENYVTLLEDAHQVHLFMWGKDLKAWAIYRHVPMDGPMSITEIKQHLLELESTQAQ